MSSVIARETDNQHNSASGTDAVRPLAVRARAAAAKLAVLRPDVKNNALRAMADAFEKNAAAIISENAKDLDSGQAKGLSGAMLDRLTLNETRIKAMADGLRQVAQLDDPVGELYEMKTRPNGLRIGRMRVPIGVIGFIYESRPNVTADAGALCVKSGNAIVLRGGSEAIHSNRILAHIMDEAGAAAGLPQDSIQLIQTTDRSAVSEMLTLSGLIDLIIPRGGKTLIERVMRESTIPVIKHYDGICHVYVDADADLDMAVRIAVNSKAQRPGVCNAAESLLVHKAVAAEFLPRVASAMAEKGVELRAAENARGMLGDAANVKSATENDFRTEFLDLIMAVRVVDSIDDAIEWINEHGSHHTESIITRNQTSEWKFIGGIDSACVHINASTRFSDGGEYGMGCEIGISTEKLHARGPMGLKELTTSKFVVFGEGQVRG
jgi:glutamate-5-semialdehyde dehydrogenase